MSTARMEPAKPPFGESIQTTLDRLMPPGVPPLVLFTTLARSERAFSRFMAAGLLDKGPLGLREREIMIDRTCARCGSEYEWGVHIAFFAKRAALSNEQIAGTVAPEIDAALWSESDRLILKLADELHEASTISDELWAELSGTFSDEQILELILLSGFYHTVAYLTNGLRLPLEGFGLRFPERT
ncbi:MAG: carboxymuconolactone decarboxylase family protein [Micropepsaceae bacterium]